MAEVGDASEVPLPHGSAAGIVSCFTLQQIPQPASVLAKWVDALMPGTSLCKADIIVLLDLHQGCFVGQPEALSCMVSVDSAAAKLQACASE